MRNLLQRIALTILFLNVFSTAQANELRIFLNSFVLTVNEPIWLTDKPIFGVGLQYKRALLTYSMLESPVLNSKGDRLTFDYTAADVPITPFAKLELDHFRRSDQGGYSFVSGTQIRFNQWVKGRIGVEAGWLTELWVPTYEIVVDVTI